MGHKVLIFLVSNKQIHCYSGLLLFYLLKGYDFFFSSSGDSRFNKTFFFILFWNWFCVNWSFKECSNIFQESKKKLCFCLGQKWHPDRCSASENSRFVDEAKKKFQTIQQAYSVLSDTNKRFLYDVGVYDGEDDENGMGGFMNEMAVMMSQTKPHENVEESFEELQGLFEEMFQEDLDSFGIGRQATTCVSYSETSNSNDKRVSVDMNLKKTKVDDSSGFNSHVEKFCLGVEHQQSFKKGKGVRGGVQGGTGGRERKGRKQEVSSGYDVSSHDHGISAS